MYQYSEMNEELVKSFFTSFMNAMKKWEIAFNLGEIKSEKELKENLLEIFSVYCTKKERKNARPNVLHSEDPPEYDIDHNIIEKVEKVEKEKNKFILYTQQTNKFHHQYRYIILLKDNALKIDKKERWSAFEQKWVKCNL